MMPSTPSLARNMFLDRRQRRYAMAVWAAMASVGAAAGPIVGGWIIEAFSWQAAFLMNIPVMLLLLVLGPLLLPESRNLHLERIDTPSVALSLIGLAGVAFSIKTLTGGKDTGLGFVTAAVGLSAVALFVHRQLRLPTPLMDVRLFTVRYFRGAVVTDLLAILAMTGALPALTQHLQLVLGLSPLRTALWLVSQAILAAAAFISAVPVKRFLPAYVITCGLLITAAGFGLTVLLSPASPPVQIATTLTLVSLGAGMALALSNDIVMSSVKPERAGQAAAISETAYEFGTTPGTATLGGLLVSWYSRSAEAGAKDFDLTPDLADRVSSTIAEALLVAAEVGGGTGAAVLTTAKDAFSRAVTVTAAAGAGVMILVAAWAFATLRGAAANLDLAEDTRARTPVTHRTPSPASCPTAGFADGIRHLLAAALHPSAMSPTGLPHWSN